MNLTSIRGCVSAESALPTLATIRLRFAPSAIDLVNILLRWRARGCFAIHMDLGYFKLPHDNLPREPSAGTLLRFHLIQHHPRRMILQGKIPNPGSTTSARQAPTWEPATKRQPASGLL